MEAPTGWRLWLTAARPRTLSIAVAPVLVGTALAWRQAGTFHAAPTLAALAGAMLIQIGTNLHNDAADAVTGGDPPSRRGPPRVTTSGWASPARVRRAAALAFALAALVGLYLAAIGGWPIAALGAASLVAGWAYSGGPWPISHSPFGEVVVVLFFGIAAVAGTAWLQIQAWLPATLPLALAMGLPAAAVLTVNNTRDIDVDRLAGRRTLSILVGAAASRRIYALAMLAPFALLAAAPPGAWMGLAALPFAWRLVAGFPPDGSGEDFNRLLAATARCQLLLAALVGLGMVLISWRAG